MAQIKKETRERFLAELAVTGNVTEACRRSGMPRNRAYELRLANAEFAAAWADAEAQAVELLLAEARRRAVEGVEKPLVHGGKEVCDKHGEPMKIRLYSDRLLEFLIEARQAGAHPAPPPLSDEERARRVEQLLATGFKRTSRRRPRKPAAR